MGPIVTSFQVRTMQAEWKVGKMAARLALRKSEAERARARISLLVKQVR